MNTTDNIPGEKRTPSVWQTSDELQQAVDKYVMDNPAKFKAAQQFGDFLLSSRFANCDSFRVDQTDIDGIELRYNELVHNIQYHGLLVEDMENYEIDLLKVKLGADWMSVFVNEDNTVSTTAESKLK